MLSLLILLSADAHAQSRNKKPAMYGVGGTLSTVIYPARYPGSFPTSLEESGDWDFTHERLDGGVAGHGVVHLSHQVRIGARVGVRGGARWSDRYLALEYDQIAPGNAGIRPYAGMGAGMGNLRFNSDDGDVLDLSNFIVRATIGALYLDRTRCYEVALTASYPMPLEHQFDEETWDARGSRYGAVSLEVGVMIGEFKPGRKGKKGNKRKGGGHR